MEQKPKESSALIPDKVSLEKQLELYSALAHSTKSYNLILGKNPDDIHPLVSSLF